MNYYLAWVGIFGGILCACADLLLDLKGKENRKLGKLGVMDSMWETMPHWRFRLSGILVMFAVPMYCCGVIALADRLKESHPIFANSFLVITLIGAMGGFMIHTFLCLCPTIYQEILPRAGFALAEQVISTIFRQIYIPFFTLYSMLVIIPAGMVMAGIVIGIINLPMWCLMLNPVVFQLIGLGLRATGLDCFIDAPSCCAASLGLAMYGVIALLL